MFKSYQKAVSGILKTFVRTKKTDSVLNASTQKVVGQLSALSASRKQPKLIKLCKEDLIKHKTISNAWKVYKRQQMDKKQQQLDQQYESIYNAMEELKKLSPELFEIANQQELPKYPLEMRLPTDYPPTKPWVYNYAPAKQE